MKSAYEAALERLEQQGIDRPRQDALKEETRNQMGEVRNRAEAQMAELEILHRDRIGRAADPVERHQLEEEYRRDRQRVEEGRDAKLEKLRREESA
jgi:hypothetical protein